MGEDDKSYKKGKWKKGTFNGDSKKSVSGRKGENPTKHVTNYAPQKSVVRYKSL